MNIPIFICNFAAGITVGFYYGKQFIQQLVPKLLQEH